MIRTFDAFASSRLALTHDLSSLDVEKEGLSLSLSTLLLFSPFFYLSLSLSLSPSLCTFPPPDDEHRLNSLFSSLLYLYPVCSFLSRHRHDQVASYACLRSFVLSSITRGFLLAFFHPSYRPTSPEWNVLLNNRTQNGESKWEREREEKKGVKERADINPQSTIPLRDPLGGLGYIYTLYLPAEVLCARAIEKTASSLIPAATFRLPAAWLRIGSGERWEN